MLKTQTASGGFKQLTEGLTIQSLYCTNSSHEAPDTASRRNDQLEISFVTDEHCILF